jgi:hypothetical protein
LREYGDNSGNEYGLYVETKKGTYIIKMFEKKIKWTEQCLSSKWLDINEDLAYKRIISFKCCRIKKSGQHTNKTTFKWKNGIINA